MQEPIGRGGMATIYRAVDLRMGQVVAAKILSEVYSTDPTKTPGDLRQHFEVRRTAELLSGRLTSKLATKP